jgi:transposase
MSRRIPKLPRSVIRLFEGQAAKAKKRKNDLHTWTRIMVVLLFLREPTLSVCKIGRCYQTSRRSVYRWVKAYQAGGMQALRTQVPVPTSLGSRLRSILPILLQLSPSFFGLARTTWTSDALAVTLHKTFSLQCHPAHVRRILRSAGFTWSRARPIPKRIAGRQELLAVLRERLERLPDDVDILFSDEADIHLNPKIGFGWTRRGQQREVRTPGTNQKAFVVGAQSARSGALWVRQIERKTGEQFFEFLNWLALQHLPGKRWVLVLDNAAIHKGERLRAWLESNPQAEIIFLPGYSPDANSIELVWRAVKLAVVYNHSCSSLEELMDRVFAYFQQHGPFEYRAPALPLNFAQSTKMDHDDSANETSQLRQSERTGTVPIACAAI